MNDQQSTEFHPGLQPCPRCHSILVRADKPDFWRCPKCNPQSTEGNAYGGVFASCGCEVSWPAETVSVRYREWTCDAIDGYKPAVAYAEYCPDCAEKLRQSECWLSSDEEAERHLRGGHA